MCNVSMNTKRIESFDGLRGIAVFLISFCWHYQHFAMFEKMDFLMPHVFNYSFQNGYHLVELLFIMSGFTLMLNYKDRIRNNDLLFKDFIFRRLKAIYPMHLITLLIVAAIHPIYYSLTEYEYIAISYDLPHFILNLLLVQNWFSFRLSFNSPMWYISVLFLVYIIFYIVIRLIKKDRHLVLISFLMILLGLINYSFLFFDPVLNYLVTRGIVCLFTGILLYKLYESVKINRYYLGIASAVVATVLYVLFVNGRFLEPLINYSTHNYFISSVLLGSSVLLTTLFFKPVNSFLSLKPLTMLGRLSNIIYFVHFPIQLLISTLNLAFGLNINFRSTFTWSGYVVTVILVSVFIHVIISGRIRKVIRKRD